MDIETYRALLHEHRAELVASYDHISEQLRRTDDLLAAVTPDLTTAQIAAEHADLCRSLDEGLEDVRQGRTRPFEEVMAELKATDAKKAAHALSD